jgi:chromosome partitioning protein
MIYAIVNQKGGTGKTTTAVNLGAAWAEMGARVLVVDLDPQAHATLHLGVSVQETTPTIYTALHTDVTGRRLPDPLAPQDAPRGDAGVTLADCIRRANKDPLDVVPSSLDLAQADLELHMVFDRERRLSRLLAPVAPGYDAVLLDCPPYLGLLTVNALAAAQRVIVPLSADFLSMQGLRALVRTILQVSSDLNYRLALEGVLLTRVERTAMARAVEADLRQALDGSGVGRVFQTTIPKNVEIAEAAANRSSVLAYSPRSAGAEAYRALAQEIGRPRQ